MYRDFTSRFDDPDAAYRAYLTTLTRNHERRVRARVLNLGHSTLSWLDEDHIVDGQVTIDTDNRNCTRVLSMRLYDPSKSLGMEPTNPSSLPTHLRRMVQVLQEIAVPDYGWMGPPVFTGPVLPIDREGAEIILVGAGKEKLALGNLGHGESWPKKTPKVRIIRALLILAGEDPSRIHLPPLKNTIHKPFNVSRRDRPLLKARQLARSMGWQLWPDGRGHWKMRKTRGSTPVRPFLDSDWLMGPVTEDRPELVFFNGWEVLGDNPRGPKPRIQSDLIGLPENHPFSAQSLQRQGKDFWQIKTIERSGVKTKKRANEIARKARDDRVEANAAVSVECLVLPNIEEWDLLKAVDPNMGGRNVRVKQATIPLVSGNMTIGAVKKVSRGGSGGYKPPSQGGL